MVLTYLVTLVSLIGGPSWRIREDVRLGMLIVPEFFLCGPQQLGGLHHVLLILMFFKPGSHQTGKVPVFVPLTKMVLEMRNITYSIEPDYCLPRGCTSTNCLLNGQLNYWEPAQSQPRPCQ